MAQKSSVGVSEFKRLITGDYRYVDKTALVYRLVSQGSAYFLSRPRRFGKSLLVSTLDAYLAGRKELFRGLALEQLEETNPTDPSGKPWVPGPVMRLDFSGNRYDSADALRIVIDSILRAYEDVWGSDPREISLAGRFRRLLRIMHQKTGMGVTVLVDEYDKPLLYSMDDPELNRDLRLELKGFYGVLKGCDADIRFLFFTGVTQFSHISIFSDLNQLRDISMRPEYNAICGLTAEEVRDTFPAELENFAQRKAVTVPQIMDKLAQWYDGYHFSVSGEGIFNPFSILSAIDSADFENYWFATGTPTVLVELIRRTSFNIMGLTDGIRAKKYDFMEYRADTVEPLPLLYQSGYLTITSYDPAFEEYTLAVPNREVKYSLLECLMPLCFTLQKTSGITVDDFIRCLERGDTAALLQKLKALLATVPYNDIQDGARDSCGSH